MQYAQYMLHDLDEYVFGHTKAKKALITMLNRSYLRFFQRWFKGIENEFALSPMKIMLIAPSGTGKTHLVESLRKVMHFPLVRVDATQFLPSGAGSDGIKLSKLEKLIQEEAIHASQHYPEYYLHPEAALDRMVVFIDEIDKLGTSFEGSGNWNQHVQSNFLTLFDNRNEYSGVNFIFAGAFSDITKKTDTSKSIGFTKNEDKIDDKLLDDKVVDSGLIPELVGRMTAIIEFDKLTRDDYSKILHTHTLPKKYRDLAAYGLFDNTVDEAILNRIIDEAMRSGQGVRYLNRALDNHFLDIEFEAGVNYVPEY
jgi:ATP-dependent Clp protease ATP-binding subunit ClpX